MGKSDFYPVTMGKSDPYAVTMGNSGSYPVTIENGGFLKNGHWTTALFVDTHIDPFHLLHYDIMAYHHS